MLSLVNLYFTLESIPIHMPSGKTFRMHNTSGVKGDNGCIIVVGGSIMYTGAPIFTALGAMRSGSELVYIFTSSESVIPIKQIPEVIVLPFEVNKRILNKATACVVGPGLGRPSENELHVILEIVNELDSRGIPFVLDADAIHLYKIGALSHLKHVVLTPNYKEKIGLEISNEHFCIEKGEVDIIKWKSVKRSVNAPSSLKRCGGQGDILSGMLATALTLNPEDILDACISSCELLRESTYGAFNIKGFSLMTTDIFPLIGDVLSRFSNQAMPDLKQK